jgi:hypothetical protein
MLTFIVNIKFAAKLWAKKNTVSRLILPLDMLDNLRQKNMNLVHEFPGMSEKYGLSSRVSWHKSEKYGLSSRVSWHKSEKYGHTSLVS